MAPIPPPVDDFQGRREERDRLASKPRLLLHGEAGVGKRELALALAALGSGSAREEAPGALEGAASVAEELPELELDLQPGGYPLESPTPVLFAARRLRPGVDLPPDPAGLTALWRHAAANQRGVIVLDGVVDPRQVEAVLEVPVGWRVILTCDRPLDLPGVARHRVTPLSLRQATELGRRRAIASGIPRQEVQALAEPVAALTAGHPLALALAWGCLVLAPAGERERSLEALQGELRRTADARTANAQEGDARVRDARTGDAPTPAVGAAQPAANLVEDLLTVLLARLASAGAAELAQRVRSLALLPSSFDPVMAGALLDAPPAEVAENLAAMALLGLLRRSAEDGPYTMHRTLRQAALAGAGCPSAREVGEARLRYARALWRAAEAIHRLYQSGGDGAARARALFESLWPHLWAALHWMRERDDDEGRQMLSRLPRMAPHLLFDVFLAPDQQIRLLREAVAASEALGDAEQRLANLGNLGAAHHRRKELSRAVEIYEQALELAGETGDVPSQLRLLDNLGSMLRKPEELPRAVTLHRRQVELALGTDDPRWEAQAVGSLANAYWRLERPAEAEPLYQRCLELMQRLGDRRGEGGVLGNLGLSRAAQGDLEGALPFYQQALEIARRTDDGHGEWNWLDVTGEALRDLGRLKEAREVYRQAVECARSNGRRSSAMVSQWNLAEVLVELGEAEAAVRRMEEVVAWERSVRHPEAERDAARLAEVRRAASA